MIDVIAELGINHDGSIHRAKTLVEELARRGIRKVKLQYRNQDRLWSMGRVEIGDEILKAELRRTHLSPSALSEIASHARSFGMQVGISFFVAEDVEDFPENAAPFDFYKVPSAELANYSLIDCLLDKGPLVLISTGGHTDEEISKSLSRISKRMNWNALHAVMNYPTVAHNAQLGFISRLAHMTGRPVGYSSHDENLAICLLAAQSGASIIERHCTYSMAAEGLDHSSSSLPEEIAELQSLLDQLPLLFSGSDGRIVNQGERINLQNLGRSLYARENLDVGTVVNSNTFVRRSPGVGMAPAEVEPMLQTGFRLKAALAPGMALGRQHVFGPPILDECALEFARANRIGIPVRPKDAQDLHCKIPVQHLEFHLSYGDVASRLEEVEFPTVESFSIHLPDYVSSTQLLDPFSENAVVRASSVEVVSRCVELARQLSDRTQRVVPIVGSLSQSSEDLSSFYSRCRELIDEIASSGVLFCFQWLPPYAWYFGGSVALRTFNSTSSVEAVTNLGLPICLDLSHFLMCAAAEAVDISHDFEALRAQTSHVHLAGAVGVDGEGVGLSSLSASDRAFLLSLLETTTAKVIEPWQGHLNGGEGFIRELNWLASEFAS